MNATQPASKVNWNGRKDGPTCACGKYDYCDYSCMRSRIAPQSHYPLPAEDESFSDWQDRRSINGGR